MIVVFALFREEAVTVTAAPTEKALECVCFASTCPLLNVQREDAIELERYKLSHKSQGHK